MRQIKKKILKDSTFIDLFAGIGGFRLALESLGATCVYSSEWDKYAREVYNKNFHEYPDGDITMVNEKNVPYHDILCAGFPCQAFSISGKQMGFNDSRGTLFFDVARVVKEKKPKVVLLENVKNFAQHDNGNTIKVVENTLKELGYNFYFEVLNAKNYGVAQNRERVYMVAFRKDLNIENFEFPEPIVLGKYVKDYLIEDESLVSHLYTSRSDIKIDLKKNEIFNNQKPIRLGIVNKGGQGERIYSINGIAITLSAHGGGVFSKTGGYLINNRVRKLHPIECAKLMGFPDDFIICDRESQAYKQFGNSVIVDVLQLIAESIGICLENRYDN